LPLLPLGTAQGKLLEYMSAFDIFASYRPDHPDWVSRTEAARRLGCSPRDIPNRVTKGKLIAERISDNKFRYYVPEKLYEKGIPVLPIETYHPDRCFILWITFSDDSRQDAMNFDRWSDEMSKKIDDYVKSTIRRDISETFRLRSEREHHNVSQSHQDPILHFVVKIPGKKVLNLNDRS
jgi:hypothetical protein